MRRFRKSTGLLLVLLIISVYAIVRNPAFYSWLSTIQQTAWENIQSHTIDISSLEFPAFAFAKDYMEDNGSYILQEQQDYEIAKEQTIMETEESEKNKKTEKTNTEIADNQEDSGKIKQVNQEVENSVDHSGRYIMQDQAVSFDNLTCYSMKQLTDFNYLVKNLYQVHSSTTVYKNQLDASALLSKDLTIDKNKKEPQILIYHTHGSEYFADSSDSDPSTLITGVGDYLTKILEEDYGYSVIHDTTVFPFNEAYSRGREKASEYLEKYPSIQVVIDMHRDSAEGQHLVTKINNKQTATIMFFNGMSQTASGTIVSRENPNLETNLAFSLQLKLAGDELFPGFVRKNYLKAYRYNMHLMGRYALIEVGAETNTLEEAKNAMEPLAVVLNQVLQ